MEVQHIIVYFKLESRNNDVSTTTTNTQIVKESRNNCVSTTTTNTQIVKESRNNDASSTTTSTQIVIESRSNDVSTTTTSTQIVTELLFQQIVLLSLKNLNRSKSPVPDEIGDMLLVGLSKPICHTFEIYWKRR